MKQKREKERGREEGRKNELEEKLVKGLVVNTEVKLAKKKVFYYLFCMSKETTFFILNR